MWERPGEAGKGGARSPVRAWPIVLLSAVLASPAACGPAGEGGQTSSAPELRHVAASGRVPPSQRTDIALTSLGRACLIDSYRVRVECGGRAWEETTVVGSEGEGPGEYMAPAAVIGEGDGSVGVLDAEQSRLTVYSPEGKLRDTANPPTAFSALERPDSSVVVGTHLNTDRSRWAVPVVWFSIRDDSVLRSMALRHESDATREALNAGAAAARGPDGEFVVWVGDYTLARYTAAGTFVEEFTSPEYEPELPTERDVQAYRQGLESIIGRPPTERAVAEYRDRPVLPLVRGAPLQFDSVDRLWAATTRDHESRSYLDVFRDGKFLGSVRVRGRLVSYEILGSTMAVLAEDDERDAAGLYPRRIHWYQIVEADPGQAAD